MTTEPLDPAADPTVGELIEAVAGRFAAAGLVFGHGYENAWDEAVALVLAVTGLPDRRTVLAEAVGVGATARVAELAGRRIDERVPLAYLLGRCWFAGHEFLIEPGIVVPRSPIGALVQARFSPWLTRAPGRVLDLCCGNGCIGIATALAFPGARVDLVDLDSRAVELARRNVALHGLEDRVEVRCADLFDGAGSERWDLIVSNPPYVDAADMASLPAEYRHEPSLGLAGGADGLALVGRMLEEVPARLAADGLFVCEAGASAREVASRYPGLPLIWPDLPAGGEGVFLLWAQPAGER